MENNSKIIQKMFNYAENIGVPKETVLFLPEFYEEMERIYKCRQKDFIYRINVQKT